MENISKDQPLRPLIVNSGLGYGGAETQIINVVRELKRRGHDPHLYLLTRTAPRSTELASLGVPITIDTKKQSLDFGVIHRLRKYIQCHQIDIVHSFLFDSNIYARIAGMGLRVPILNAERSSNYRLSSKQKISHALTRWRVDGVVANSHAGRSFAQNLYQLPRDQTHVTWNGIDLTEIAHRCRTQRIDYKTHFFGHHALKMAIFVGAMKASKDHGLALAVSDALIEADPTWRVVFVGTSLDGSQVDHNDSQVAESARLSIEIERRHSLLKNRERILFIGQRQDALEMISQSNVLFSTSVREGFPNAILEAMAVGTPVVTTNYSDIRLIIQNNDWIIDSRNPLDMALAIIRANECRASIGSNSKRWVAENATIEKSTDAVLQIYKTYITKSQI